MNTTGLGHNHSSIESIKAAGMTGKGNTSKIKTNSEDETIVIIGD